MKIVLSVVLLAVFVSRSDAVRCEDIQSCVANFNVGGDEDVNKLCMSLRSLLTCMRSSLDDCRNNGGLPESALDSMDQQMQTYSSMLNDRCEGYGSGSVMKLSAMAVVASFLATLIL